MDLDTEMSILETRLNEQLEQLLNEPLSTGLAANSVFRVKPTARDSVAPTPENDNAPVFKP